MGAQWWSTLDTLAVAAVTLAGAALRLWRLGSPNHQVFDENFYAKDACNYATTLVNECGLRGFFEVHPPMGKWPIALGIKLFGFNSFGVRIFSAVAGAALIAITYVIAKRLLNNTPAATVAACFVAFDLLLFVHSRLAMLDIFLALFIATGFLFVTAAITTAGRSDVGVSTQWWLLAGVSFGFAIATKWIAAIALVTGALLVIAADARHSGGEDHPLRAAFRRSGWRLALSFLLIPLAVYVCSYIGRVHGSIVAWPWHEGTWFRALWDQHGFMLDYFETPREHHFYETSPFTWLSARTPFPYFFETEGSRYGGVMAAGSPLMWWPAIAAIIYGAWRWVRSRADSIDVAVPMTGLFATYGGWLLPALFGYEHFFIYYFVPAIPFLALLVASGIARVTRPRVRIYSSVVMVASWVGFLLYMYPMLAAVRVDASEWATRVRLYDICPVPRRAGNFALSHRLNDACRVGGLPFREEMTSERGGSENPPLSNSDPS